MKLAANYSKPLLQLLNQDRNLPVDYIKVPVSPFPFCWGQFKKGHKYRDLLPHPSQSGILAIGHHDIKKRFNLRIVHRIIHETNPPFLSTNIQAKINHFPGFESYQHEYNPDLEMAIKKRLNETISMIKHQIKIPLILENYPYYSWVGRNIKLGAEPAFISELCETTDCGFLLDIPHAKVSSRNMNRDVFAYISRLPLGRLMEIHISGAKNAPGVGVWDSNTVLEEEDYQILEFVLRHAGPKIVTIEYGGYPDFQYDPRNRRIAHCLRNSSSELLEMINRISLMIKSE